MFRALRRKNQALSQEECEAILQRGETCVLALAGDDGYPYAVPVNYCYEEYSTHYQSVIAFGRMRILEEEGEMRRALSLFAARLAPGESEEARLREIDRWFPSVSILEFTPEHISGKQSLSCLPR